MERRRTIVCSALIAISCAVPHEGEHGAQTLGQEGSTSDASDGSTTDLDATSVQPTDDAPEPSTAGSGSGGPGPACGNGILDVGEVCDDGNDRDADGCNVDCRPSGELVFELLLDPEPSGNALIRDLDHAEDGTYVVGGQIAGMGADAWAARFTQDDELMWDLPLVVGAYDDLVFGVAAGEGGRTYVAGVVDELAGSGDPWVAALSPAGAIEAADRIAMPTAGRFYDVTAANDGVIVVGHQTQGANSHGLVRLYDAELALETELEPIAAAPGLAMRNACTSGDVLITVGQRLNANATVDGLVAMIDAGELQWMRTTQAQQGQHSIALGCAVAGEAEDRRLWSAGYDTAATPRWLATLRAYAVGGMVAIDVPIYVGEDDLGAVWSDVATDKEGNVIVGGATVVGAADHEYAPVLRKHDPNGATLWTRTFSPGGLPHGAIDAVDVGPEGAIRVAGYAADRDGLYRRWLARLTP